MSLMAHAGHWLVDLFYLSPVLALLVAIGVGKWRDRQAGDPGPVAGPDPDPRSSGAVKTER